MDLFDGLDVGRSKPFARGFVVVARSRVRVEKLTDDLQRGPQLGQVGRPVLASLPPGFGRRSTRANLQKIRRATDETTTSCQTRAHRVPTAASLKRRRTSVNVSTATLWTGVCQRTAVRQRTAVQTRTSVRTHVQWWNTCPTRRTPVRHGTRESPSPVPPPRPRPAPTGLSVRLPKVSLRSRLAHVPRRAGRLCFAQRPPW